MMSLVQHVHYHNDVRLDPPCRLNWCGTMGGDRLDRKVCCNESPMCEQDYAPHNKEVWSENLPAAGGNCKDNPLTK